MSAFHDLKLTALDGQELPLAPFKGQVVLVVNVASKCGLTPQYEGLEKLHRDYKDKGLVVAGFPANDFGAQEPGSNEEIATFCTTNFGVDFPMFEKIVVTGPEKHPLYAALTDAQPAARGEGAQFREKLVGYGITPNPEPEVLWNFEKFLIAKDGSVVARFAPTTAPDDADLVAAVEAELAK